MSKEQSNSEVKNLQAAEEQLSSTQLALCGTKGTRPRVVDSYATPGGDVIGKAQLED